MIQQGFNVVAGVNVVGMKRSGMTAEQIEAIRRAYHVIFREGSLLPYSLAQVERELGTIDVVAELVTFIRQSTRGINLIREHRRSEAA